MPTSPTMTTRPRSRQSAAASSTGSSEDVAAVISTASHSADAGRKTARVELAARCANVDRADLVRALEQRLVEVDADDRAAGRPQQHARDLADEAEADDRHALAEAHVGLPNAVHRDRSDGCERALLEAQRVGQADAEVAGHVVDLGVHGVVRSAAGDAVPGGQVTDQRARAEHDAGGRVAERGRVVELRSHGGDRVLDPVTASLLEHDRDLVRARAGLLDEVLAAGLHLRSLGPRAQQAGAHVDEHAFGRHRRKGNLEYLDLPVAQALRDLLHERATTACLE